MLDRFLFRIAALVLVRPSCSSKVRVKVAVVACLLLANQSVLSCRAADEDSQVKAVLDQYYDSQFVTAKKLCQSLLAGHPKNLTARYLLGNICVKLNQLGEAEAAYKYCLRGGKDSTEAVNAYTALEQIYEQRRVGKSSTIRPAGPSASMIPTAGTNHSSEESIQDETARLQKDAQDKLAIKQRTLDDRLKQEERSMHEQIANSPRGRRAGFFRQEYQAQVRADYQDRVDRLKKEFEREKDDINQACQKRIDSLREYHSSIENRKLNR